MTGDELTPHLGGLGDLFAFLWDVVSPHVRDIAAAPWTTSGVSDLEHLQQAIEDWSQSDVPDVLIAYLLGGPVDFKCDVAPHLTARRAFMVMAAIDIEMVRVHPRGNMAVRGGSPALPPIAIEAMQQRRWVDHAYGGGIMESGRTVAKGPLLGNGEEDDDQSGDRLDLHFRNLVVFKPPTASHSIRLKVLHPRAFSARAAHAGPIGVGVAAIAEERDDLAFEATTRSARSFLDVRPRDEAGLAAVTSAATERLLDDGAELIVYGELCTSSQAIAVTAKTLRARAPAHTNALIILGSGLSKDLCPSVQLPFNECTVLDDGGRVLWRQRKCHHFRMAPDTMDACGIARAGDDAHTENVAAGDVLEVRDVPGVGRVMVLICEDLQQTSPGFVAAETLRPDWIFSPVLDTAFSVHRWTMQRSIEISRRHGARIVIATSNTLEARKAGLDDSKAHALLVDAAAGRRYELVKRGATKAPGAHVVVRWEPAGWQQYKTVG